MIKEENKIQQREERKLFIKLFDLIILTKLYTLDMYTLSIRQRCVPSFLHFVYKAQHLFIYCLYFLFLKRKPKNKKQRNKIVKQKIIFVGQKLLFIIYPPHKGKQSVLDIIQFSRMNRDERQKKLSDYQRRLRY